LKGGGGEEVMITVKLMTCWRKNGIEEGKLLELEK